MNVGNNPRSPASASAVEARHELSACANWLRVGFVGASAFGAALAMAFSAQAMPLLTLATGLGGGLLAVFAWRRARVVLGHAESVDATVGAGVPRLVLTRFSSGY